MGSRGAMPLYGVRVRKEEENGLEILIICENPLIGRGISSLIA